jgi:hypothetical protein
MPGEYQLRELPLPKMTAELAAMVWVGNDGDMTALKF